MWLLRRLIIEAFRALQPFRIIHGYVSHRCARAAAAVVAPVLDRISPVFSPFSPRFFPVFCGFSLDGGAAALPAPRLPLPPCLAHAQR